MFLIAFAQGPVPHSRRLAVGLISSFLSMGTVYQKIIKSQALLPELNGLKIRAQSAPCVGKMIKVTLPVQRTPYLGIVDRGRKFCILSD